MIKVENDWGCIIACVDNPRAAHDWWCSAPVVGIWPWIVSQSVYTDGAFSGDCLSAYRYSGSRYFSRTDLDSDTKTPDSFGAKLYDEDEEVDEEDDQDEEIFVNPGIPRWRQPLKPIDISDVDPDDRCPCGSGRKYKNCHGAKQAKPTRGIS